MPDPDTALLVCRSCRVDPALRGSKGGDPCEHLSATGIDTTPADDSRKVWRCDACGVLLRCVTEDGVTRLVVVAAGGVSETTEAGDGE